TGDTWLANNLPAMIEAVRARGLVILTWDEDDGHSDNCILTVFAGPLVKPGYVSRRFISHYTVVRTIGRALGLAASIGAPADDSAIVDVWQTLPAPTAGIRDGLARPGRLALRPPLPHHSRAAVAA